MGRFGTWIEAQLQQSANPGTRRQRLREAAPSARCSNAR
jgi:hypothetical protein